MSNDAPKPGPFRPKRPAVPVKKPEAKEPKKQYRPKPHLTHKPLSDDELLARLIKDTGHDPDGPYSDKALFDKLRNQTKENNK